MVEIESLSDTQRKVLRMLARVPNMMDGLAGNGRGPILSAARALERKGVLRSYRTSHYAVVSEYHEMARVELARWIELRNAAKEVGHD